MYMFLYSNLIYFFFIIYVQYYPEPLYMQYQKIIRALHGQLTSLNNKYDTCAWNTIRKENQKQFATHYAQEILISKTALYFLSIFITRRFHFISISAGGED